MAKNYKRESDFQADLKEDLEKMFPGCIVLKNDANYCQGIPDLSIFYKDKWAMLECKKSEKEPARPNQPYYVEKMNSMSFSRFVYPENKEEVLDELQRAFGA